MPLHSNIVIYTGVLKDEQEGFLRASSGLAPQVQGFYRNRSVIKLRRRDELGLTTQPGLHGRNMSIVW